MSSHDYWVYGYYSYSEKIFYRESLDEEYIQIKKVFYRESLDEEFRQVYQYDETKPIISITSAQGYINNSTYVLTGRVIDEHSWITNVTIDDVEVVWDEEGYFSKTFTNISGLKVITVKAVDVASNETIVTVQVNYDITPHVEPLTDLVITNISYRDAHNYEHGKDWWCGIDQIGKYFIVSETKGTYTGLGLWAKAEAWYSGRVQLAHIPNYESIKRVKVYLYGRGAQIITVPPGSTYVTFSDYDEWDDNNSYFSHGPGERWGVKAKAGIYKVEYFFAD